jgi:predicted lactoylglutathione lyase
MVIILRSEFAKFTAIAGQPDAPKGASECILSYFTANKEEVNIILQRATSAGGINTGKPTEQPWGYAGYLKDPDGHLWEVMYNAGLVNDASK